MIIKTALKIDSIMVCYIIVIYSVQIHHFIFSYRQDKYLSLNLNGQIVDINERASK